MKKTLIFVTALVLFTLNTAFAENMESFSFYDYINGYSSSGVLSWQGETLYYFDYTSGEALPVCTHPECNHDASVIQNREYESILDMLNDSTVCYAARLGHAAAMGMKSLLFNDKIYSLDCWMDPFEQISEIDLYESQIDGETRILATLNDLLPQGQQYSCSGFMIDNGKAYLSVSATPFSQDSQSEELSINQTDALSNSQLMTETLFSISLSDGKPSILKTYSAQSCSISFLGIYDGILYFTLDCANGFTPMEQCASVKEWFKEFQSKKHSSVLGIDIITGDIIIPHSRLYERVSANSFSFDVVKDGILYSIIWSEDTENNSGVFMKYDLRLRKEILEYPILYQNTPDFYPYFVLNDEIMLAFQFESGTFALRNLKTDEIQPMTFPGICFHGNEGQSDWYDISTICIQTNPIILFHIFSDDHMVQSYITAEELLSDNPVIHDFN